MTPGRLRNGFRRVCGGLLLVGFGVLAALIVLEVLLQLGAVVTHLTGRELPFTTATGRTRVLCLGDSNTYGFYLERSEAYPQVLERLASSSPEPLEVLNLGQPGINSSRLRNELPRLLRTFRPDIVTLMVGVNDFWTVPVAVDEGRNAPFALSDLLWRVSRVYRFLFMLRRSFDKARVEVSIPPEERLDPELGQGRVKYGDEVLTWKWEHREGGVPDFAPALHENVVAMAALARAAGAETILLTYPSEAPVYGVTNRVLRATAAAAGLPLIDLGAAFRARCATPECPDLFFPDNHPRAAANRIAAGILFDHLQRHPSP